MKGSGNNANYKKCGRIHNKVVNGSGRDDSDNGFRTSKNVSNNGGGNDRIQLDKWTICKEYRR